MTRQPWLENTVLFKVMVLLCLIYSCWAIFISPLSPAQTPLTVIIEVNEQPYAFTGKPILVNVKRGQNVKVAVTVSRSNQNIAPGEMTYTWCYNPPVNNNVHCNKTTHRTNLNSDFTPSNTVNASQSLEITIKHQTFDSVVVMLILEPQ